MAPRRPALAIDAAPSAPAEAQPLPPVESLTFESDFTAFMQPEVDPGLRRQALKTLLQDPRFNVMDGLDVYIDDYSKPDPLPEGWLEKMKRGSLSRGSSRSRGRRGGKGPKTAKRPRSPSRALPKAMAPEPVSFPEAPAPADTSSDQNPPPDVGKSGVLPEGN